MFCTEHTLPNLKSAALEHQSVRNRARRPTFQVPEIMTDFLRAPSLRIVELKRFCLTNSLCQAFATALPKGSSIASLVLDECSFPEGGSERIASALKENATLTTFRIITTSPDIIHQAFTTQSLSNSTLEELSIRYTGCRGRDRYPSSVCLSPLLLALGMNKTLRMLCISGFSLWTEQ
jgi:hypothetical protein